MTEAVEIRLRRARSWLRKARNAAGHATRKADPDAQFVFLWIAFNALYGKPRYRRDPDYTYSGETADFVEFLDEMQRLAYQRCELCLKDVEPDIQKVLWSHF